MTGKRISLFTLVALIGIVVVGLGLLAFSLNAQHPDQQESNQNTDLPQTLRGTITQVEQGKDGLQVQFRTDYFLYSVTISMLQTEIIGDFDQIKVGTEIEVSGQGIAGTDPPLIVAEQVTVLEISTQLTGETWVLTAYKDKQPISEYQPTLLFESNQVSGNTGCNHYGGSYQINGEEISFEGIYSTEMACLDPEGLMVQERIYLELISSVTRFKVVEGVLTLFAGSQPILTYQAKTNNPLVSTSTLDQTTLAPMATVVEPTLAPTFEPPVGFKEYTDSVAGVSVFIPESWNVTGVIAGQYAIFQSYPEDKYVGGEAREPGDTKCDLNLLPSASNVDELIQQWETAPQTTIVSDEETVLKSGLTGRRFVIESMGRAVVLVVEINQRIVKLTCYGNFTPVDSIAQTLSGFTAAP